MQSEGTPKRKADMGAADVSPPATKRVRSTYSTVLTINVGKDQETQAFIVHKDLVAESSPYMKAATTPGRWLEGQENKVDLPEYQPHTVQIYLEWLYNPEVDLGAAVRELVKDEVADLTSDQTTEEQASKSKLLSALQLAKCWVLGDYLGDIRFKNSVMRTLSKGGLGLGPIFAVYVLDNTSHGSRLHEFMLSALQRLLSKKETNKGLKADVIKNLPEAVARDLLVRFAEQIDKPSDEDSGEFSAFLEEEE